MHIFMFGVLLAVLLDFVVAWLLMAGEAAEWSGTMTVFMVVRLAVLLPVVSLEAFAEWIVLDVWPARKIEKSPKARKTTEVHETPSIIG